jgi:LysR family transcriptional regulator for metE and metH
MHLEVKHLKLVQAIQQERSITNAGVRLHLTQSAVSHQLKEIEDRLGTPLFVRTRRDVRLTRAGERLLNSAAVVLNELQRAEEDIAEIAGAPRGAVRISTQCHTAYHWLPTLVKRFSAKYPYVAVEINVDATYRAVEAVLEGALDLALTNDKSENERLRYRSVFDDELVAVLPASHPLAERDFLRPKDFAEESLLVPSTLTDSNFYHHFLKPAEVMPRRWSSIPLTEAIIGMVKEEMGISVTARWIVQPYLKSNGLRAVRISKKGLYREWWAVMLNRGATPKYLDDFISLMSTHLPASLV